MNTHLKKFLDEFEELHPNRRLLFLVKAGSHFFDLNGPNSDQDFRGVYMPSPEEFHKGESKRPFFERKTTPGNKTGVKNTKEDIDLYLFSYTKFLELLARGDFNCMELLYTPESKIILDSPEFRDLMDIRKNLLVNDISAFLGFIKKEYRRYGININHYKVQKEFSDWLKQFEENCTLKDIWSDIQEYAKNEAQIIFTESCTGNKTNLVPTLKIAQRFFQDTVRLKYVINQIDSRLAKYGHRQKKMAADGVEFKGLYHALRLIYEANDLYDHGEFKLPFDKERHAVLKSIKDGTAKQDYIFDLIDTEIDKLVLREKGTVSNKRAVQQLVDKLTFSMAGKKSLEYVLGGNSGVFTG